MKTLLILIFLISSASANDLSDYMDKEGFRPTPDMQKFIEKNDLEGWEGTVYTLDEKRTYFVVKYAAREEVEKVWKGEYSVIDILCVLTFSYEGKRCIKAVFFDKDGKEHKINYNGKRA